MGRRCARDAEPAARIAGTDGTTNAVAGGGGEREVAVTLVPSQGFGPLMDPADASMRDLPMKPSSELATSDTLQSSGDLLHAAFVMSSMLIQRS